MIISDTSALVLNWTSKEVWKSENARNYFARLDLSSANALYKRFDKELGYMQTQLLSNRKFFIRKTAVEFLEKFKTSNVHAQVIILAAGIDPLSVELASLYPESIVFDVDKYSMKEKEKHLNYVCANIKFVDCDITNIEMLNERLIANGWNAEQPGILILEGITYYLTEKELRNVLSFFAVHTSHLACDFGIKPECVDKENRMIGIEIVSKIVKTVGLEFMNCYDPVFFMKLVEECGFTNAQRIRMESIQVERTAAATPFKGNEPAWVALVKGE